jgi:hypothetical protein
MSTEIASILALIIYALGVIPVASLGWSVGGMAKVGGAFALLLLGFAFTQTGLFQRGSLARSDVAGLIPVTTDTSRCKELFRLLDQAGVTVNRANALDVPTQLWDQMPKPIRDAITECAARAQPAIKVGVAG